MINVLSTAVSIISLVLAIGAMIQAAKYNKESTEINADTKKFLNVQLEEIQKIEKQIARDLIVHPDNVICMAKDNGSLYKLKSYDKSHKTEALELCQKLRVKRHTLERIQRFLENDQQSRITFNFFVKAEGRETWSIAEVREGLQEYGILLVIDYQVWNQKCLKINSENEEVNGV